jgi:Ribbon-helix-helix protein, copG family
MQRTQIYLTDDEQTAIRQISVRSGLSQSALIRKAIDQFIDQQTTGTNINKRMDVFGLWQDNDNLPNLDTLRREDRFIE